MASAWERRHHEGWQWLNHCARREAEEWRLFPWAVIAFGVGILLYFQADDEPNLAACAAALAFCTALAWRWRGRVGLFTTAVVLAAIFAGLGSGVLRSRQVAAPVLAQTIIVTTSGFIETVDERQHGARLVLLTQELQGVPPGETPRRIRVGVRDATALRPGQFIVAKARLMPPPEPAVPGGYDFARDLYFRGIGAVGTLLGRIEISEPPQPPSWRLVLTAKIDRARNVLADRIAASIGGPAGGVAAALVTGKRGLIPDETNDVLRAAGIYHIVSISGLHMVLAAGIFFWVARALLALFPAAALTWPLKKIAALVAMVGATAYCIFSGSEVATERSLITTLVLLGAILVDRPALSIRNVTIAALIVLILEPEALLGPSFQMSFAAVLALIAVAQRFSKPQERLPSSGAVERALRWLVRAATALTVSTLVAGAATAPFSAYHFQTANPLGVIGNALALPLVSAVVMPSAALGVIAYPFGLDRPVWQTMGAAISAVLDVSGWVSGLAGSTVVIGAFGPGVLLLMVLALLGLTLLVSPLRWFAMVPALAGLALAATPDRPDMLIGRDGAGAAIRGHDGRLLVVGRASPFVVEHWTRADGDDRSAEDPTLSEGVRCDRLGCVANTIAGHVAVVRDRRAFEEDCRRATIIVSRLPAPTHCGAAFIADSAFLARHGATAVRFENGAPIITAARRQTASRPWARHLAGARATSALNQPGTTSLPAASDRADFADDGGDQ